MKRYTILLLSFCFIFLWTNAETIYTEKDTILFDLDEMVIYPREQLSLQEQPVSYTSIGTHAIEKNKIDRLGDISFLVPNFYLPNYGSRYTSSIFIRGIGARTNEPAVGLYVDNIPFMSKSAFDFSFFDLQNIEVLRGPQGTLYGRNSIGGLVRINTLSAFNYQGIRTSLSYGSRNDINLKLSGYHKISEKLAFSLGGFYTHNDGFFRNIGLKNDQLDKENSFGARTRWEWEISPKWKANINASYENVRENAYPYGRYNKKNNSCETVNYNYPGRYSRDLATAGITFQRNANDLLFTSTTSYQFNDDCMKVDQDFTPDSIFALTQKQRQNFLTQELTIRSKSSKKYQWVNGVFAFYKHNRVDSPMTLYLNGLKKIAPNMPNFVTIKDDIPIPGDFRLPSYGVSLYHQSAYTIADKLTFTVGLRLEYEQDRMKYHTSALVSAHVVLSGREIDGKKRLFIDGNEKQEYWEVLPKFSMKYDISPRHSIFASIAKGYKAGGYNFTMFSNTFQNALKNIMVFAGSNPEKKITPENSVSYKPEYSWNYEIGLRTEAIHNILSIDLAAYFIKFNDQQIVVYAQNGSRMVSNAAKSQHCGAEASIALTPFKGLRTDISYGFLWAKFKKYTTEKADYTGNFIPFAPQHTLSVRAEYGININRRALDRITLSAQYNAAGNIYFNEKNDVKQKYYGVLNGNISFLKSYFELTAWIKNATNEKYYTFYCESLGNSFVQQARPLQVGGTISVKL